MREDQEYSPKYWVFHEEGTDDVFIETASKSLVVAESIMDNIFIDIDWRERNRIRPILVEIKKVEEI